MQPNPFVSPLFTGETATTVAGVVNVSPNSSVTVWITGTGTTSSGVVTLEEAADPGYAGTWSSITTVNASDVTGGATKAIHLPAFATPYYLRVRISTTIGGGGTIAASVTGL